MFISHQFCRRSALTMAAALVMCAAPVQLATRAQTITALDAQPDVKRALAGRGAPLEGLRLPRKNGHPVTQNSKGTSLPARPSSNAVQAGKGLAKIAASPSGRPYEPAAQLPANILQSISPGTLLSRILHTSQLSINSSLGTNEEFVDSAGQLVADQRTTFDSTNGSYNSGGSFDIAVGASGSRYEVFSATTPDNRGIGVLVVGVDSNGDYVRDFSASYDLGRDFSLPSAVAVVSGTSRTGREFVIVSSSGYFNSRNPNDPYNEPTAGVVLLVRDNSTGGFDNSLSHALIKVGDRQINNANSLTLLPNNDLLIADLDSNQIRIVRDTDGDGIPDTLDPVPYYSYKYSNDAPISIASNARGVVFSHSYGSNAVLLAIHDDERSGYGTRDEVVVQGLSLDNNIFLHGLSIDGKGNVYVIEDATGAADTPASGGNAGAPRIDAFPDPGMDGHLQNGVVFAAADDPGSQALSGLAFQFGQHPIDDPGYFVNQQYRDFLGREPDQSGFNYWVARITQCGFDAKCINTARIAVSAAFFIEQEFQDTGYFVYRFYKVSFGRQPLFQEFTQDRSHVIGGSDIETSKQAFADQWVQRPQFLQTYPAALSNTDFVNRLFDAAQLKPGTNERSQEIAAMAAGRTRGQVVRDLIEIQEFKNREYNSAFVLMQYFGYLKRDADQGGYQFWLNVLDNRQPGNYRGMVCSFITSAEYQDRFSATRTRSNSDCAQ